MSAFCVVSDSGTITEESTILDFPAVTIRQAHERPEEWTRVRLLCAGSNRNGSWTPLQSSPLRHSQGARGFRLVPDYDTANVSKKVLRIICSYTDYVNRTVWRR